MVVHAILHAKASFDSRAHHMLKVTYLSTKAVVGAVSFLLLGNGK